MLNSLDKNKIKTNSTATMLLLTALWKGVPTNCQMTKFFGKIKIEYDALHHLIGRIIFSECVCQCFLCWFVCLCFLSYGEFCFNSHAAIGDASSFLVSGLQSQATLKLAAQWQPSGLRNPINTQTLVSSLRYGSHTSNHCIILASIIGFIDDHHGL